MSKTILITGSTDGIGLLTAKALKNKGHQVILHGRSDSKLKAAATELGGDVATCEADLSSLDATADLAKTVIAKHNHIDVLINNAGVYKLDNPVLPNGHDVRFVVNTLTPYALTKALLAIIPKDGRIINLSSAAQAPVDIRALEGEVRLDDMGAYSQSKRAIRLWSQEMAHDLPDGPSVLAVNPGSLLASKMVKEGFGVAGNDLQIGVDILCRLALDAEFEGDSGKYWDNDSGGFSPAVAGDAKGIMKVLEKLTS